MENKKSTKRRVIAITVLASLLIALLAFNVTYAYFTDKIDGSATLTFGIVDIDAGTDANAIAMASATNVLPGQTIKMQGKITNSSNTPIWVKFGVDTNSIKLKVGSTEIAVGTQNPALDNRAYQDTEPEGMKDKVEATITAGFRDIINNITGAEAWKVDGEGVTLNPVPTTATSLDLSGSTAGFTFTGAEYGNLFQGVTISFNIVILAVQTEGTTAENAKNLSRTDAIAAFSKSGFNSGEFSVA